MIHIIGNCAAVGSSVLSQILNRHSSVFSGVETHLFSKKQLYQDWSKYKHNIHQKGLKGLRSPGWHLYNGVILDDAKNVNEFDTFLSFANSLKTTDLWIEKTPVNVYCFAEFLDNFPKSKVIYMVRDPLETIASLCARGLDVFNAVSRYLTSNAAGLSVENPRIYLLKYEDLVQDPMTEMKQLSSFINIEFESQMLLSDNAEIKMKGWRAAEDGPVLNLNSKRFESLTLDIKSQIVFWINHLQINPACNLFSPNSPKSISDIAIRLGYNIQSLIREKDIRLANLTLKYNWLKRTIRTYPTGCNNYPLMLNANKK